eukprot:9480624-Pyramimonas_sp.AAC.1
MSLRFTGPPVPITARMHSTPQTRLVLLFVSRLHGWFGLCAGKEDQYLLVATDGLWDVFEPQEAADWLVKIAHQSPASSNLADLITAEAQIRWQKLQNE